MTRRSEERSRSLADLAHAVNVVKGMRFQYPIAELAQKFFSRLVGL